VLPPAGSGGEGLAASSSLWWLQSSIGL
jgi:hypothetical protein